MARVKYNAGEVDVNYMIEFGIQEVLKGHLKAEMDLHVARQYDIEESGDFNDNDICAKIAEATSTDYIIHEDKVIFTNKK